MIVGRVTPILLAIALLTGCSAGQPSGGSTQSATESPSSSAPPAAAPGGGATDFCGAFKEIDNATGATDPTSLGTAFRAAATDMRTFAPAEIAAAAGTYADLIDEIGIAALSGAVGQSTLMENLSKGMKDKAKDIGTVAVWVGTNCAL